MTDDYIYEDDAVPPEEGVQGEAPPKVPEPTEPEDE